MSEETKLAPVSSTQLDRPRDGGGLYPGLDMEALYRFCQGAVQSELIAAKTPQQAMVIILAGREYGLAPMAALMNGHMIKGKFSLSADMLAAIANRHGALIELIETTDTKATYRFGGVGRSSAIDFTYSLDDAKAAKLYPGKEDSNWKSHTKAMLRARALSQGIRAAYPGMVSGAYLEDELKEMPVTVETTAVEAERPKGRAALGLPAPDPEPVAEKTPEKVRVEKAKPAAVAKVVESEPIVDAVVEDDSDPV